MRKEVKTMHLRKFVLTLIVAALVFTIGMPAQVYAAEFSDGEIEQVHHFQHEYARLSKKKYNRKNIYAVKPRLGKKFRAGRLKKSYINSQLAYINYYRSLFGLTPISTTKTSNLNAQKTAAVMAAINANPFINQHGLPSETRPHFISKSLWKLAQDTSETSNLNFNVSHQSAGDVVTDLVTDHYNLTGTDTGHRAWLLSTRLSKTGIGAAYGSNGYRYSVQKVLNTGDLFRVASQASVAYPSTGLFPVELAKGKNIAWSLYLSDRYYTGRPKITIRDVDTNRQYNGLQVRNYSSAGYGNFKTVITYSPGKMPIIAGHEYEINIEGLYKYTFKLFRQSTTQNVTTVSKAQTYQSASGQKNPHLKSAFLRQNAKLWAVLNPKNQIKKTNSYFDSLKKGQWTHNFLFKTLL